MSLLGILVGPGVVSAGCVEGLHAFADRVGSGVVNTWGAKGVFRWDDRRHFGTAGLQARDFELAGLGEVDVLVTSGLDPAEVTSRPWAGRAEVIDIAPADLATCDRSLPAGTLDRPALYTELAAVVGPLYEQPGSPPARAAALAADLPDGATLGARPGLVGFWVARTFPTARPGSVRITGEPVDGEVMVLEDEDWAELDLDPSALVAVAGPIVAWGGVEL
ncbi:MAG: hypothetical protein ACSLFP_11945 [Acidimicrobiales bacterium]